MNSRAVVLGFLIGVAAYNGFGLLAFVLLVGYVVVDAVRSWGVG